MATWSEFLAGKDQSKPIRLKTAKIRGEYSQGLALPLTVLPEHVRDWQVGADVGGELGITKYEKEIPAVLSGVAKGEFPTRYAPRTDEDNGNSHPDIMEMVLQRPVYVTQKLDGSSCTVVWSRSGGVLEVCSRNLSLLSDSKNGFWHAVNKINWKAITETVGDEIVFQGELMGPGVQGNQLELKEPTLYLFQAKQAGRAWYPYDTLRLMAGQMNAQVVPLLEWDKSVPLQDFADSQKLPSGLPAEGIVVRTADPLAFGDGRPMGFKIINRNYKE